MNTNTEKDNNYNPMEQGNAHIELDNQGLIEKEDSSFREKVTNVIRNITVEPCMFMVITAISLYNMASQNLQLEKACRVNLNFSTEICDSLILQDGVAHSDYERETQHLLAKALAWKTYLTATLTCIIALFIGSFSDKTGHRKLFLIVLTTGLILNGINSIINVYFFYETTLETIVFSGAIIEGLSGGLGILFITCFAYISAITTDKDRTFRIGILVFCTSLASPIGTMLSGVLLNALGYYGIIGISIALNVVSVLYTIFVISDPKKSPEQQAYSGSNWWQLLRIFFNISNVKDTMNIIIRKAPNSRRLRLCILLLVVIVLFGPFYGETSIMYLNVRYRFKWDEVQYSLFQSYNLFTNFIGTALSILVIIKYLGWHDSLLGIISTLSKIAASFIYCFAQTGLVFYFGPMIDIMNGIPLLAMRSIMSKMVEGHEIGKLSSLVGIVENLSPLIYVPLYAKVYSATMEVLPGAVFLVGGLLMLPAVVVLCYLFYEHRMQVRQSQSNLIQIS
ncbi:unnamed protein product [Arctia plantaginis]|uniref:Uncharacterized protein n=1 Tax=Arctia plantaginis TaxID=874455 RepID=A0A8S1AGI3_ARCPL|nr:unnamed protein product [Arctia plantaginis]